MAPPMPDRSWWIRRRRDQEAPGMSTIPLDGQGRVDAVNVGQSRELTVGTVAVTTAIWKSPVTGRRQVRRLGVEGDQQADLRVHGGPGKAVYVYASESTAWWAAELGIDELPQGMFGENLTTSGLDVDSALVGERWRVGSALLQVTQPRVPCYKLGIRFDDPAMPRRFAAAGRPGAYLRVLEEGELGAGDDVVVEGPPRPRRVRHGRLRGLSLARRPAGGAPPRRRRPRRRLEGLGQAPGRPASCVRAQVSRIRVTGPSLTSSTAMSAPKRPVATSRPACLSASAKASTRGSATGPGAAPLHDGRRPLRVSAYSVNWLTTSRGAPSSSALRSPRRIRRSATLRARAAATSGVSSWVTPTRTTRPARSTRPTT